jgi:hypothetical protein
VEAPQPRSTNVRPPNRGVRRPRHHRHVGERRSLPRAPASRIELPGIPPQWPAHRLPQHRFRAGGGSLSRFTVGIAREYHLARNRGRICSIGKDDYRAIEGAGPAPPFATGSFESRPERNSGGRQYGESATGKNTTIPAAPIPAAAPVRTAPILPPAARKSVRIDGDQVHGAEKVQDQPPPGRSFGGDSRGRF